MVPAKTSASPRSILIVDTWQWPAEVLIQLWAEASVHPERRNAALDAEPGLPYTPATTSCSNTPWPCEPCNFAARYELQLQVNGAFAQRLIWGIFRSWCWVLSLVTSFALPDTSSPADELAQTRSQRHAKQARWKPVAVARVFLAFLAFIDTWARQD